MAERLIQGSELVLSLSRHLTDIVVENIVFLVAAEEPRSSTEPEFVLGPVSVCGQVCGLVDPEYGWPHRVNAEEVRSISDLAPGRHRHPFVYLHGRCVAIAVSLQEYRMICVNKAAAAPQAARETNDRPSS